MADSQADVWNRLMRGESVTVDEISRVGFPRPLEEYLGADLAGLDGKPAIYGTFIGSSAGSIKNISSLMYQVHLMIECNEPVGYVARDTHAEWRELNEDGAA